MTIKLRVVLACVDVHDEVIPRINFEKRAHLVHCSKIKIAHSFPTVVHIHVHSYWAVSIPTKSYYTR